MKEYAVDPDRTGVVVKYQYRCGLAGISRAHGSPIAASQKCKSKRFMIVQCNVQCALCVRTRTLLQHRFALVLKDAILGQ